MKITIKYKASDYVVKGDTRLYSGSYEHQEVIHDGNDLDNLFEKLRLESYLRAGCRSPTLTVNPGDLHLLENQDRYNVVLKADFSLNAGEARLDCD